MRDETVERFPDLLQNIEVAIYGVYQNEAALLDLDVIDALDALVRRYFAEEEGRTPPALRLAARAAYVYETVQSMCEWRLGRAALDAEDPGTVIPPDEANSISDILLCLKRIRKSARMWNEQGGRQGYLDYIAVFLQQTGNALASPRF
ncbi:MAG TPA: hypothetical protein VEK57_06585 [Thermoanaerobaculia bacterium]|nr:hypothetical protein [Thermoanaerobaculia bacterium]